MLPIPSSATFVDSRRYNCRATEAVGPELSRLLQLAGSTSARLPATALSTPAWQQLKATFRPAIGTLPPSTDLPAFGGQRQSTVDMEMESPKVAVMKALDRGP